MNFNNKPEDMKSSDPFKDLFSKYDDLFNSYVPQGRIVEDGMPQQMEGRRNETRMDTPESMKMKDEMTRSKNNVNKREYKGGFLDDKRFKAVEYVSKDNIRDNPIISNPPIVNMPIKATRGRPPKNSLPVENPVSTQQFHTFIEEYLNFPTETIESLLETANGNKIYASCINRESIEINPILENVNYSKTVVNRNNTMIDKGIPHKSYAATDKMQQKSTVIDRAYQYNNNTVIDKPSQFISPNKTRQCYIFPNRNSLMIPRDIKRLSLTDCKITEYDNAINSVIYNRMMPKNNSTIANKGRPTVNQYNTVNQYGTINYKASSNYNSSSQYNTVNFKASNLPRITNFPIQNSCLKIRLKPFPLSKMDEYQKSKIYRLSLFKENLRFKFFRNLNEVSEILNLPRISFRDANHLRALFNLFNNNDGFTNPSFLNSIKNKLGEFYGKYLSYVLPLENTGYYYKIGKDKENPRLSKEDFVMAMNVGIYDDIFYFLEQVGDSLTADRRHNMKLDEGRKLDRRILEGPIIGRTNGTTNGIHGTTNGINRREDDIVTLPIHSDDKISKRQSCNILYNGNPLSLDLFLEIIDTFFLVSYSCFTKSNTPVPFSLKITPKRYKVVIDMMPLPALFSLQDTIFRIIVEYEERRIVKSILDPQPIIDCLMRMDRSIDETLVIRFLLTVDSQIGSEQLTNFIMRYMENNPTLFIRLSARINREYFGGMENFVKNYSEFMKMRINDILEGGGLLNDEKELEGIIANFGRFMFDEKEKDILRRRFEEYENMIRERRIYFKKKRSSDISRIIRVLERKN